MVWIFLHHFRSNSLKKPTYREQNHDVYIVYFQRAILIFWRIEILEIFLVTYAKVSFWYNEKHTLI